MRRINVIIFFASVIIAILGLITLLSTELTNDFTLTWGNIFVKQVIFIAIGIAIFLGINRFDFTLLKYKPIVIGIYALTILLLLSTILFGQEVNGARRWISIFGVQLQPSEIAKITVILTTAYLFQTRKQMNEWLNLLISGLVALPIVLLVYIEPHGSMSLLLVILWFVTVFLSMREQFRNILLLLIVGLIFTGLFTLTAFGHPGYLLLTVAGIILAVFVYFAREHWRIPVITTVCISLVLGGIGSVIWNSVLSDYQRERIVAFQNPESTENSFNVEQSKIAIGSGGLFGKGFANGTQSRLQFLPFHQTDFIFAAYAEEFGLIGTLILLTLFFMIFWNIFLFPIDFASHQFESILVVAIGLKILLELFINLGTNLGISPATGIPLPLMSAGGTITIMTFFSLGLVQSIITKVKNEQMYKPRD